MSEARGEELGRRPKIVISLWDGREAVLETWNDAPAVPRIGDHILLTKGWMVDKIVWAGPAKVHLYLVPPS
jgi:hypothetical protein